ncbi:hypothetical protein PR001_g22763 [Phytophthora rubi]|uniref:Nudix hydrolase domain-containing protein n=1 Tax=Phytophthora rubi TaxID=129364 RepID=A0A6A3J3C0_9STRA|nr:hypothetical protein PR001_g22763 [Phytophthora rubi]
MSYYQALPVVSISKFNADVEAWNRALAADRQTKRSLRRYDEDDEERGIADKIDDALAIVVHKPLRLPAGVSTAALAKVDDVAGKVQAAMTKYPAGLSESTLQQLMKVEQKRLQDIELLGKMTKKTTDGMRRDIKPFQGMKTAPIMHSHVGRDMQRYLDNGKTREMTVGIVSRSAKEGGGDVLLISSSNPKKNDWLLPKGGWDQGESLHKAAWREVIEEGGVNGAFTASLGSLKAGTPDKGYLYHIFKLKGVTTYDQWSESVRYRVWVSYEDAMKMLVKRPDMVEMVKRAQAAV